ncbi:MAG: MFS transporter [Nanoarchaeales archaeon]|nr:MFS transporter [Nanoarchaeales archaeon]
MIFSRLRKRTIEKTTQMSLTKAVSSIGFAGVETVWAIYMSSFGLTESMIGFISAILIIIMFMFSFFSTIILEKFSEVKIYLVSSAIIISSLFIIGYSENFILFLVIWTFLSIAQLVRAESFTILFRDESSDSDLEKNEGLLFTVLNLGWLVGPLIAGFILLTYGVSFVFVSSGVFILIASYIFYSLKLKEKVKKRDKIDTNIKQNLKEYFTSEKLILPYLMKMGLEIWWALIYIYIPLFIIKNGFQESLVGFFLAAVVIPLILFEFEVGTHCEKYGFKNFFFIGFFSLFIISIIAFFMNDFMWILGLLVLASAPAAMLEPIQSPFFFRQVSSNDEEKYYPIYITSLHIGSFIAKFTIAGLLLFFVDKYVYLLIAGFMLTLAIISLRIKNEQTC